MLVEFFVDLSVGVFLLLKTLIVRLEVVLVLDLVLLGRVGDQSSRLLERRGRDGPDCLRRLRPTSFQSTCHVTQ